MKSWLSVDTSLVQFSSVQLLSHVWLFGTPCTTACQASLSITNPQRLPKLMSIELMMPSNYLILCCPFSFCLHSLSASGSLHMSQFFTSGGQVLEFQLQHQSFQWMDWLDLLVVQGTLKSLLQHHSSKASILQCSAFFIVQLSHPYWLWNHWTWDYWKKPSPWLGGPLLAK